MNNQSVPPNFSRRKLIKYGGGIFGTSLIATVFGCNQTKPEPEISQNDFTPDEALAKLMEGNQRFVKLKQQNPNQTTVRLQQVAAGQTPFAAVLSCADSRVPLEIIFDRGIGDIFVFTLVGFGAFGKHPRNIVPIMLGVFIGSLAKPWNASDAAIVLAALFGTTLAPIAGRFGWHWGIVAGFIHSSAALSVGSVHAGLNLYNNGFAAGIVAAVLVPVIIALTKRGTEVNRH